MPRPYNRKSSITVTDRADGVKTRNVALARRLAGNPHGAGTRAIPLKTPDAWHTYIANTYQNANEFWEMKQKGWDPLEPNDLACPVEESGFQLSTDGRLVRGPQGQEMVFKMSTEDYEALVAAKTRANMKGIGSASKVKQDMTTAAASQLGDEAADYIHNLDGEGVRDITGGDAG